MKKQPPTPAQIISHDKRRIANMEKVRVAKWAIFRGQSNQKTCRFTSLMDTKEEAIEQAKDLTIDSMQRGASNFTYFVVRVEHEVGFIDGKLLDQGV